MKPFYAVPHQALADLLRAAGSPLTPEQYVASLTVADEFRRYPGRAWTAAVSKYFLLVVAVLGLGLLPFLGLTVENIFIEIGLCVVTFFEYRVHTYFRTNDPRGPVLGFRNQAAFAGAIVIYCIYHAVGTYHFSADTQILVEENNVIDPATLKSIVRLFYLFIAVLAGGSQFGLALFYRSARVR